MSPKLPHPDQQFKQVSFLLSEKEHCYGPNIHILSDPFLLSHLARLCAEETAQPVINELVTTLYGSLLEVVVNREFPMRQAAVRTRMAASHFEAVFQGPIIDPDTPVVSVNLARAGTLPSHICYTSLNYFMNPKQVRQDHISIARTTDEMEQVTGSRVSGHKIGGMVDDSIVLFPDPMGATGGTLVEAIDMYKKRGKALKYIALHCIVTPEYLRKIQSHHPDLLVYAIRLDRGLSPPEVLDTVPGTHWDRERGLNHKHYIVPGGGGFGEIMNNAYV
ncbi:MAG: uracil phosphoribosyltransferase [Bdellovibrionales bacterium RIFOXYC1_FULL_54_43]|nr:MAG: uracil phosphoribosyltransferase [Bdellovibrionales bacterium RIFOXYC1_FULL_54_43]OFZ82032.1 MAG: uracil phosphoribosyltransferase [Bdellovibrionales bacterium RIFOXYD1_FULL_55_31]